MSTINTELLYQIADAIEVDEGRFDQTRFGAPGTDGATPCCVGGWALLLSYPADQLQQIGNNPDEWHRRARLALGLTWEQAQHLFAFYWPTHWLPGDLRSLYDAHGRAWFAPLGHEAAAVLRRIARDEITWRGPLV